MPRYQRAVLMGDPTYFRILGASNPHTRNWLGMRKHVSAAKAMRQWHALADTLADHGVLVFVIPPEQDHPGLVYPANAGFLTNLDAKMPLSQKTFYLSNLLPTRAGEREHYEAFLRQLGFRLGEINGRFEGEADFFPVGQRFIFTHGKVQRQRFVPQFGIPPWRYVYGFRSDESVLPQLQRIVGSENEILDLELINEAHYHGDTALCSLGEGRHCVLAYLPALSDRSMARLGACLGGSLVPLEREDGAAYAANSFQFESGKERFLLITDRAEDRLLGQIKERGVEPIRVDVSEFWNKGGGSVKCMIGDLGWIDTDGEQASEAIREFRATYRYEGR